MRARGELIVWPDDNADDDVAPSGNVYQFSPQIKG